MFSFKSGVKLGNFEAFREFIHKNVKLNYEGHSNSYSIFRRKLQNHLILKSSEMQTPKKELSCWITIHQGECTNKKILPLEHFRNKMLSCKEVNLYSQIGPSTNSNIFVLFIFQRWWYLLWLKALNAHFEIIQSGVMHTGPTGPLCTDESFIIDVQEVCPRCFWSPWSPVTRSAPAHPDLWWAGPGDDGGHREAGRRTTALCRSVLRIFFV